MGETVSPVEPGEAEGVIVTSRSGWYEAAVRGRVLTVRPRGRLRKDGSEVLTGDRVVIRLSPGEEATIERVLPRRNRLLRPPVANVDRFVIVFTLRDPPWNRMLTDRVAVAAEAEGLDGVFVLNKIDLADPEEAEEAAAVYRRAGYPVIFSDARRGRGVERLREFLHGRVTVLAGESGVGKSTLLNAVQPGLELTAGEVSRRKGRGRHTTRHVRLLPLTRGGEPAGRCGEAETCGYVVDTPGFSRMDLTHIGRRRLAACFPEFRRPASACRFEDCLHRSEPGCGVKRALEENRIDPVRYRHYLLFLESIEAHEANLYR